MSQLSNGEAFCRVLHSIVNNLCGGPCVLPRLTVRVTDPHTTNYFEGTNLLMNITNTQFRDLEVKPQNRLGGPAAVDFSAPGSGWSGNTATNAFTVVPNPLDPENKLKCRVIGNPESAGGLDDVGIAHFEADGDLGDGVKLLVAETAVNVTPSGAGMLEVTQGEATEQ